MATELAEAFARVIDRPITLVKDADAWLVGAITWARQSRRELRHPTLALVLGTAVGLSMTPDGRRIDSLEMPDLAAHFPSLERASGQVVRNTSAEAARR